MIALEVVVLLAEKQQKNLAVPTILAQA